MIYSGKVEGAEAEEDDEEVDEEEDEEDFASASESLPPAVSVALLHSGHGGELSVAVYTKQYAVQQGTHVTCDGQVRTAKTSTLPSSGWISS